MESRKKYDIAPIEIARNNQLSINGVLSVGVALNIGTGNIARSMQAKKRSILYSVKQGTIYIKFLNYLILR